MHTVPHNYARVYACTEQAEERLQRQLLAVGSQGRGKKITEKDLPDYLFAWLHEASGSAGPACLAAHHAW